MQSGKEVRAFFESRLAEGRKAFGQALLPGERRRPDSDFVVACHGGRDAAGAFDWLSGYLPYADANGVVLTSFDDLWAEPARSARSGGPVLAGLCGSDPFRAHGQLLGELKAKGCAGICNYPSVGLMDGSFRTIVEQQGLGFELETRLVRCAADMGLFTLALVFSAGEADAMLDAGADALAFHPGLACIESSVPAIDGYLRDIEAIAGRLPAGCPLFACCIGPRQMGTMAQSLLYLSGFLEVRWP